MNAKVNSSRHDDEEIAPAAAAFQSWLEINKPVVSAMSEIGSKMVEQAVRVNHEWLGFVNRRLREDIETSQRLMACKTMPEVFRAYAEYVQNAQQQYQAEFQYLAHLNQKLAGETVRVMQSRTEALGDTLRH